MPADPPSAEPVPAEPDSAEPARAGPMPAEPVRAETTSARGTAVPSRRIVTACTLLGENTFDTLAALCARLSATTGLDVRFDPEGGLRASDDTGVWRHDVVWACGLLSVRSLESGVANADIVAAPVFAGEDRAHYRSVIVAHADAGPRATADVARARVAINELASWSGCHALIAHLRDAGHPPRFAAAVASGSHRRSARAVAEGEADVAAIDHTVWEHLERTEPALTARVAVIERTRARPAPPLLLGRALPIDLRERLIAGLEGVGRGDVIGLERIERRGDDGYRELLEIADRQAEDVHVLSVLMR